MTKILAAKRAATSGAHTVIAWGREEKVLTRLAAGEAIGTQLTAQTAQLTARKQWMADHLTVSGRLTVDAGAVRALAEGGRSLLPIGVLAVSGEFERGAVVAVTGPDGKEIARGLVNYASAEAAAIAASHRTLVTLFPLQTTALNAARAASLAARNLTEADPGIAVGESAAAAILSARTGDGASTAQFPYAAQGAVNPGVWVPIGAAPALLLGAPTKNSGARYVPDPSFPSRFCTARAWRRQHAAVPRGARNSPGFWSRADFHWHRCVLP